MYRMKVAILTCCCWNQIIWKVQQVVWIQVIIIS